ncbi:cbb3-type cytochrome oxidase assembly protein CcoS [Marinospirillum sp.]|uniref:cbb3-type cytochrome oxidase assembly protein CcoS n=1 Tax=Marinospirillum sp. TaxID=2183934 RepID=UPI003A8A3FC5
MNILFLLIPLSIVLLSLAIWAFFWAVKNDQFEDLEGPAYSILFDDDQPESKPKPTQGEQGSVETPAPDQQDDSAAK